MGVAEGGTRGGDPAAVFTDLLAETVGPQRNDPPAVIDEFVADYLCGLLGPDADEARCLDAEGEGEEVEETAEVRSELLDAVTGLIPALSDGDEDSTTRALAFAQRVRAHLVRAESGSDPESSGRDSGPRAAESPSPAFDAESLVELFPMLGLSDAARYLRNAQNQGAIHNTSGNSVVEVATEAVLADLDSGALQFELPGSSGEGLSDDVKKKIKQRYAYEEVRQRGEAFRPCNAVPNGGGHSGGAGAGSKARYRDGVLVANNGAKYIYESVREEWDGGSKGKVMTKGKRGKGYVG